SEETTWRGDFVGKLNLQAMLAFAQP
ncbi:hypothetical protein CCACVL1_01060, partial [Corchorus capsularis]